MVGKNVETGGEISDVVPIPESKSGTMAAFYGRQRKIRLISSLNIPE
jgi:hypothetical protein